MNRIKKLWMCLFGILIFGIGILIPADKVYALSYEPYYGVSRDGIPATDVEITTIIENEDQIPAGQKNKPFDYAMYHYVDDAIYYGNPYVFQPSEKTSKMEILKVRNGGKTNITYPKMSRKQVWTGAYIYDSIGYPRFNFDRRTEYATYRCKKEHITTALEFRAAQYTDDHYSLVKIVEKSAGVSSFTYDNNGMSTKITPKNWVLLDHDVQGTKKIELYFKYNADIQSLNPQIAEPDISRKIDYLGDGVKNPDAPDVNGVNDYRVYSELDTSKISKEEDPKDVLFICDVSGSMASGMPGGKTRLTVAKETLVKAVKGILKNPSMRISVILMGMESQVLFQNLKDVDKAVKYIDSIQYVTSIPSGIYKGYNGVLFDGMKNGGIAGGTNYGSAFSLAKTVLAESRANNRQPSVFFLTDGKPQHAEIDSMKYSSGDPLAYAYAISYANGVSGERVYSVFIGDSSITGQASDLQTVSSLFQVDEGGERYVVRASRQTEIDAALERFIASVNNALSQLTVDDIFSKYVSYTGGLKVERVTKDKSGKIIKTEELKKSTDYTVTSGDKSLKVTFKGDTAKYTIYRVSYNVRLTKEAFTYQEQNDGGYPHEGWKDTDYEVTKNKTSSNRPGFFVCDDKQGNVSYSYRGYHTVREFPKPVAQLVVNEKDAKIVAKKELQPEGATVARPLKDDEFTFYLHLGDALTGAPIQEAKNKADGTVTFTFGKEKGKFSGRTKYQITELKENREGIIFNPDNTVLTVYVWRDFDPKSGDVIPRFEFEGTDTIVNKYKPKATEPIIFEAFKELKGPGVVEPKANEFQFGLYDGKSGDLIETVSNDAADPNTKLASVKFANAKDGGNGYSFDAEGDYTMRIQEIVPQNPDPRIQYDQKSVVVHFTVEVDKTNEGRLIVNKDTLYYENDDQTIRNVFTPNPADPEIILDTILTGQQLTQDKFKYRLVESSSNDPKMLSAVMENGNDTDGKVRFKLPVKEPGEYIFNVYQVPEVPEDEYMTYDQHQSETNSIRVTVKIDYGVDRVLEVKNIQYLDILTGADKGIFRNHYQLKGNIW